MQNENTRNHAEKFERIPEAESNIVDISSLRSCIEKINERLDSIEFTLRPGVPVHPSSFTPHPSMDRFAIAEAIADEIFAGMNKERACTFEPNGKPCDHCAMCSSRGF
ncbi:MAG: hypothetical protein ACT4O9_10955 [Blastocatellia bacterium]